MKFSIVLSSIYNHTGNDWSTKMISVGILINKSKVVSYMNSYLQSERLKLENCSSYNRLSVAQTPEILEYLMRNPTFVLG